MMDGGARRRDENNYNGKAFLRGDRSAGTVEGKGGGGRGRDGVRQDGGQTPGMRVTHTRPVFIVTNRDRSLIK